MKWFTAAIGLTLLMAACSDDESAIPATGQATTSPRQGGATETTVDGTVTSSGATFDPGDGDALTCWTAPPADGDPNITFTDVTEDYGLVEPLTGMRGHAAAWGDINGNQRADLVVGTFAHGRPDVYRERGADGPAPDRLLIGEDAGFAKLESFPEMYGRTSGAVFVDLDGNGQQDLILSRNVNGRDGGDAVTEVLRNDGGELSVVESGIDPELGGRSVGVLDVDDDGLLDLVVVEDHYRGGRSRLYRNLGDHRFEDVTGSYGFPDDVHGLGVATGDLSGNGHSDLFIAGSNRLFVGTDSGLEEVPGAIPDWTTYGNEDDVSGAAIADVNRDGKLDLVVGHHFNSTLSHGSQVPVRLYLNHTEPDGPLRLEDVTEEVGLIGLPTKAPHVEIVDLNNNGWPDILTTASAGGGEGPAVFRHLGVEDGIPRFAPPEGLGNAQYWVTGPTADVDRDGRLDVLLVEWEPALPSKLLRNTSASGHWLEVSVGAELGGGVGTRVHVYEAGGAGDVSRLLGAREIVVSLGYTAGVEPTAHFGLGDIDRVDLVVTPPQGEPIQLDGIDVDRHLRLPVGC